MAEGSYCDSCDSCDYCDTECEDGCEVCNTCQSFCELGQNSENGFSFSKCIASGEIIGPPKYNSSGKNISTWFTRDTWNEAITAINNVYNDGDYEDASEYCISKNTSDEFMTFAEYKRVADAIGYSYPNSLKKDEVIRSKYFSDLETKIATLKYKSNQCNRCNTSCNTCETCEDCDAECDWCDWCDSCDFCDSGCCETKNDP